MLFSVTPIVAIVQLFHSYRLLVGGARPGRHERRSPPRSLRRPGSEGLEWNKSLRAIHDALAEGLALWLDFSATPRDQKGDHFPWAVVDYPLAQAVEDRIVKAPIIVHRTDDVGTDVEDPGGRVTKANAVEKYGFWLEAAVHRYREHEKVHSAVGVRPVLFVMSGVNAHADSLGEHFRELGFEDSEVHRPRALSRGSDRHGFPC